MCRSKTAATLAAVVAICFATVAGGSALHAQSTTPTPRHQRGMMGDPLQGITLTPAQKVQIDSIRHQYQSTNDAMRAQYEALRTARASNDTAAINAATAQIQANHKTWRAQTAAERKAMEAILTPDQRAQLKKNWQARAVRRKQHNATGSPAASTQSSASSPASPSSAPSSSSSGPTQ